MKYLKDLDDFDKLEKAYVYQGPVIINLIWFLWSFIGFFISVFNENDSGVVQLLYLASSIFSVMALNNRRYGVNHSIRLYHGHLILLKMPNIWMMSEGED